MLTGFADGALFGERYGSGDVEVVALHGWQRTHTDFAELADIGSIALDLPGFGASPPPDGPWGSAAYAEALVPVFAALDRPAIVIGHSFGGRVALQLAARIPERIRGLVLTGVPQIAPAHAAGRSAPAYRAIRLARRLGLVGEARLDAARERYGSRDYREATGVLRGVLVTVLAERYGDLLPQITCPVELVWGALDTAAPVANGTFAHERLASSRLTILDGVGHMVPLDAPQALRDAIGRIRT